MIGTLFLTTLVSLALLVPAGSAAPHALGNIHGCGVLVDAAQSGNSRLLNKIVSPLNALIGQVQKIATKVKHGDTSAVPSANSSLGTLSSAAKQGGAPFKDIPTTV